MADKELTLVLNADGAGGAPLGDGSCACADIIINLHNPTLTLNGLGIVEASVDEVMRLTNGQYRYLLSYDDAGLVDPSDGISQCDIKNICCKDCVIEYIQKLINFTTEDVCHEDAADNYFIGTEVE